MPDRGSSAVRKRRRRARSQRRLLLQRTAIVVSLIVLTGVVLGFAFAGSTTRLAGGVRIAGVDVGGLTPHAARLFLQRRARALARVPVVFRAGTQEWKLEPRMLGVETDWGAAVASARREGEGFGLLRGFRRLDVRVFGSDISPPVQVYDAALRFELDRIARAIEQPTREASMALDGLQPVVVPGNNGVALDRAAAASTIVRALSSLVRSQVDLPVRTQVPSVEARDLTVAAAEVRTALSAPITLTLGPTTWRIRPTRIARLLELPADGRRGLRLGGPAADEWFASLQRRVNRAPSDADWQITTQGVRVVPDRPGYALDVPQSADALLRAALVTAPALRTAQLVAQTVPAGRPTAEAQQMHIVGLVSSFETLYGGDPNRIHNVQLVSHLLDRHLIAPGATFSFNAATGERSAAKGFLEAPVIINGELQTGLGGGVCQVSTTVFNAAYEAGLPITARTNHALYISHYPQGRDATVDYPNVDLKFVNDTGNWLLLRTWVGPSSLTVALYGTPTHRRVVSDVAPLVAVAPPPTKLVPDPSLAPGGRVLHDPGAPARTTSVRRRVYTADGKLLYDSVFYSSYRAEPRIFEVGPKPKKKPPRPKKPKLPAVTTSTTTTTSTTIPVPR